MKRLRKIFKWSFIVFSVLLVLVGAAASVMLFTDWGRKQTLTIVSGILKDVFEKGGVDIAKIEGDPFHTLTLRKLVVRDSRNAPMVTADSVEVKLDLAALFNHQVRISYANASPLVIRVQYDDKGVYYPLPKAAPPEEEPKEPTKPEDASQPWLIVIDRFTTKNAYFAYEETDARKKGKLPVYDVSSLALDAGLVIDPNQIKIYLHDVAALSYGLSGGATFKGEVTYLNDILRIDWLQLGLGASQLLLAGEVRNFANVYQDITIFPSYVLPSDLRRILPDVPVLTSLQLSGTVKGHLEDLTTDITAVAPNGGSAHISYTMNIYDKWISWGLSAQGESFDLARWLGSDFPGSSLNFSASAIGVGFGSDAIDENKEPIAGTSNIERFHLAADGLVDGYKPAKVNVVGSYRFGLLRLEDMQLTTPTGGISAAGYYFGETGQAGVGAKIDLPEIEQLPIPLGASGSLFGEANLQTDGKDIFAQADLKGSNLQYDLYKARNAKVQAKINYKDKKASGYTNVNAGGVDLDGFVLSSVNANVTPDAYDPTETFHIKADAALPTGEKTDLSATIAMKDTIGVDLHQGKLALSEAAQFDLGAAHVEVEDDKTTWSGVTLKTQGGGEVSTDGSYFFADGTIKGEVKTITLALAPFLRSFGVVGVPISGMMTAQIELKGKAEAPNFSLDATIDNGSVAGLTLGSMRFGYDGKKVTYAFNPTTDQKDLSGSGEVPLNLYKLVLKQGPMVGDIHVKDFNLQQVRDFLPDDAKEAQGLVSIDLSAKGDSYDPAIDGSITFDKGSYDVWTGLGAHVGVKLDKDQIHTDFSASLEDQKILSAEGSIELSWQKLLNAAETLDLSVVDTGINIRTTLENIDLATLLPKLPESYRKDIPVTAGKFETTLDITGTIGAPDVSFVGDLSKVEVVTDGKTIKDVGFNWDFSISEGDADLSGAVTGIGGGEILYQAQAPADLDTVLALVGPNSSEVMKTLPIGALLAVRGLDPYKLPWDVLGGQPAELGYLKSGTVGVELAIVGTMAEPVFRYVIALEDAFIAGDPKNKESLGPLFVALDGQYEERGMSSGLSIAKDNERWFTGEMRIDLRMSTLLGILQGDPLPAKGPPFMIDMSSERLELADVTKLLNLDRSATGTLNIRMNTSGNIPLTWPAQLPSVQVSASSTELTLGSSELNKMEFAATISPITGKPQDGRASFGLLMKGPKSKFNSELRIDGFTELHLAEENPFDKKGQVKISAENFDIGFGQLFDPAIKRLSGRISTNKKGIIVRDPFGAATMEGTLSLEKGELIYTGLDTRIEDLNIESSFTPKKDQEGITDFDLKKFTLHSGRGQASLTGEITLASLSPKDYALSLTADEFEVPYSGTLMAKLNKFAADISGDIGETSLNTKIVILRGSYELPSLFSDTSKNLMPLGLPDDILLVDAANVKAFPLKEEKPEEPTSVPTEVAPDPLAQNPFSYVIDIDIPNKLSILNPPPEAKGMVSALSIQLGGNIRMESAGDLLSIVGEIDLQEGSEVSLINNRFKFSEDSKLTFIGADLDPRLALSAVSDITPASSDGSVSVPYHVKLSITGTASAPEIDFTSDPLLEKAKILQLILTGKIDSVADAGQQSLLTDGISATAKALGNSVAQLGVGLLIQNTPLALLTNKTLKVGNVEFNLLDLIRADLEQVEIGRHVFKKCYLDFFLRRSAEGAISTDANNLEANFSCRLTGRAGFNLRYGSSSKTALSNGSADILWSKDY